MEINERRIMYLMKMATAVFIIILAAFVFVTLFCYGAFTLIGAFLIVWGFSDVFTGQNGLFIPILKIFVGCMILVVVDWIYEQWRG